MYYDHSGPMRTYQEPQHADPKSAQEPVVNYRQTGSKYREALKRETPATPGHSNFFIT
jgi:hypothetical protein